MQYRKYTHIERLGRDEVYGILNGTVYISPKIDGTNSVLYLDDQGNLAAGSRKRVLTLIDDNAGFAAHAQHEDGVKAYLARHPHYYVYGEWLIKTRSTGIKRMPGVNSISLMCMTIINNATSNRKNTSRSYGILEQR